MKEFVLTKPYKTIDDMLNSDEVEIAKRELAQGIIKQYAIVSRKGNRYDLSGNKIENYVQNPFISTQCNCDNSNFLKSFINIKKSEEKSMKYLDIEKIIDKEIENAVEKANIQHTQEIAKLKADHEKEIISLKEKYAIEIVKAKDTAKAELIAKLNG